jgi:hypothetical protein
VAALPPGPTSLSASAPVAALPPGPALALHRAPAVRLLGPPPRRAPRLPVGMLSLPSVTVAGSTSGVLPDWSERLLLLPAPARPVEDALAGESLLLARAVRARAQDPVAALRALDAYDAAHPLGRLRDEARLLRLDALLRLGRRADALRLLDALPLTSGPRAAELRQLRAALHGERFSGDASQEKQKEGNTP